MEEARRYNSGKLRYGLISDIALKELAKVYTAGADKYTIKDKDGKIIDDGSNNWRKGLPVSHLIDSTMRHIQAFKEGEDFDKELGTYHLANAAWNIFTMLDQYKNHPEKDDRIRPRKLRIGLDIDNVLADFCGAYKQVHGGEIPVYWKYDRLMKKRLEELPNDFWLNVPPLIDPRSLPFEPVCYITSRPCTNSLSEQWIDKMGFPTAPVFTVDRKLETIKQNNLDVFVDDSYDTFEELTKNGIVCYLYDAPHNRRFNVGYKRIKNLNEIA